MPQESSNKAGTDLKMYGFPARHQQWAYSGSIVWTPQGRSALGFWEISCIWVLVWNSLWRSFKILGRGHHRQNAGVEIAHLGGWKMTWLLDKRLLGNMISSSLELPASRRDGKMFLSCHSRQMYIAGFLPWNCANLNMLSGMLNHQAGVWILWTLLYISGGFPRIGSGENLYVRDFEGELWHEKCLLTHDQSHCRNCESTSNFKLTRLRNVNIILWTCDLGDFYPKRIQTPSMLRCQCCFPWKKPRRRWPGTWTSHGSSKGPECWYNGEVDVLILYIYIYIICSIYLYIHMFYT